MMTYANSLSHCMASRRLSNLRVLTAILAIAAPSAAQQLPAQGWVGTWATAAMRDASATGFHDQTLRQIAHVSVGGTKARIRISNLFGTEALRIEDVHIALRAGGASTVATPDSLVLFGGRTRVLVDPGKCAVSDPVAFRVPALADVVISMYAPDFKGPATFHAWAHETNYIATGDVAGQTNLNDARAIHSSYFLSGLDVFNAASPGSIVAFGASITEGFKAQDDHRWTDDLAKRLLGAKLQVGVLNMGITGNRLLVDGNGPSALSRFDRDVLAQTGARWVIFADDPINDLGMTRPPPTGKQLIAGIRKLIARAHARNLTFFCSTLTPFEAAGYWTPEEEQAREEVNAFLRRPGNGCDAIVDQDGATHDPDHPARFLPAYDGGDHLHPNNAGHAAIARAVPLSLFKTARPLGSN